MSPFARQDDDPAGGRGRRFRLVEHASPARHDEIETDAHGAAGAGLLGMISARLLVDGESWIARVRGVDGARALVRAEVPLLAPLARIRSEADAALALTGVIELLARRFRIGLPCGDLDGEGFCFHAPGEIDLDAAAEAVDGVLMGTVRATDLQGALRDRARARLSLMDGVDDPRG